MSKLGLVFNISKSVTQVNIARQAKTLSQITYRCFGAPGITKTVHSTNSRSHFQPPLRFPLRITERDLMKTLGQSQAHQQIRCQSGDAATASGGNKVEGEAKIKSILAKAFPAASKLIVDDISGGCGSMYQVYLESTEFEGLSIVKQHQLVNKALKDEIKIMHGIRIETKVAKK